MSFPRHSNSCKTSSESDSQIKYFPAFFFSHKKIWNLFGPYSCLLNIDEVDDLEATWADVAQKCGIVVVMVMSDFCRSNESGVIGSYNSGEGYVYCV
jgi:hypothetical protein